MSGGIAWIAGFADAALDGAGFDHTPMCSGGLADCHSTVSPASSADADRRAPSGAAPAAAKTAGGTGEDPFYRFALDSDERTGGSSSDRFGTADPAASWDARVG
jgi:hypothetical protein